MSSSSFILPELLSRLNRGYRGHTQNQRDKAVGVVIVLVLSEKTTPVCERKNIKTVLHAHHLHFPQACNISHPLQNSRKLRQFIIFKRSLQEK